MKALLVAIMFFSLISCKKEDVYVDPRDQYLGTYSCIARSSSPNPSQGNGEITVSKVGINDLYLDLYESTPHVQIRATFGSNDSFTLAPTPVKGNYSNNITTFSGNGRFSQKGISLNLIAENSSSGKLERQIVLLSGILKQ
jgi:hypothetical protein